MQRPSVEGKRPQVSPRGHGLPLQKRSVASQLGGYGGGAVPVFSVVEVLVVVVAGITAHATVPVRLQPRSRVTRQLRALIPQGATTSEHAAMAA